MDDVSLKQYRVQYYERQKQEFDQKLEKMWRIFWEKTLYDSEYAIEVTQKFIKKSLDKVWLSNKKFDPEKMPSLDQLFTSPAWWFAQITGTQNIKKEIQRIIYKQSELEEKRLEEQNCLDVLNPVLEGIVNVVLQLKACSNQVIVAAWFQEDRKKPFLVEIEKSLKISVVRGYRSLEQDDLELPKIRDSKWTLLRINAHFRFYYLWKDFIPFEKPKQKEVVEKAYLEPCPDGKFHVKDRLIGEQLKKSSSEIKDLRNYGGQCVLISAQKDSLSEVKEFSNQIIAYYAGKRIWRYKCGNISEGLNIREPLVLQAKEMANG